MNPRQKAVFEVKQIMRLGSENPVCVICGESNPLRLVLPNGHHVTGKKRDPKFQRVVCASCHQELHLHAPLKGATFGQCEGPIPARTAARLRALALAFDIVADYLRRWANGLEARNRGPACMPTRLRALALFLDREAKHLRRWAGALDLHNKGEDGNG